MGHFSLKNIAKPTRPQLRKLAKILIVISQPSAALALFSDNKYGFAISAVIGSLGLIGAALAEMYSDNPAPNEN